MTLTVRHNNAVVCSSQHSLYIIGLTLCNYDIVYPFGAHCSILQLHCGDLVLSLFIEHCSFPLQVRSFDRLMLFLLRQKGTHCTHDTRWLLFDDQPVFPTKCYVQNVATVTVFSYYNTGYKYILGFAPFGTFNVYYKLLRQPSSSDIEATFEAAVC